MTFVLSAQLDSGVDPNMPWKIYQSYLKNNKKHIPGSVYETIENPNWQGGSQSWSPYMADLKDIEFRNIGTNTSSCKLVFQKHECLEKPIEIGLEYKGLLEIDFPRSGGMSHDFAKTWRYHQFLVCDAWAQYGLKGKYFTHQIEFVGGLIWSISASEIQVNWSII